MDSILLQKQLRDNANDIQDFCRDIKNWGDEMKRKETTNDKNKAPKTKPKKSETTAKVTRRIGGTDYAKWDKFDVEAECEKLDEDIEEDEELTDECDESLRDEALIQKDKGNKFVKNQQWNEAIKCYTKAIDCYSYDPIFYANRALCYLRRGDMAEAEKDCDLSIKLDKTYVKAFQRRAAAREAQNKLVEAKQDLLTVLRLEPKNTETKAALDILRTKMGEDIEPPDITSQRPVSKFTASRKNITQTEVKPNESSIKTVIDTSKPSWKSDEDIIPVKAIKKPPHLQSKKPLKRIQIVESNNFIKPVEAFKKTVVEKHEILDTALPNAQNTETVIHTDNFQIIERKNPESITKDDKNLCNINLSNDNKKCKLDENENKLKPIDMTAPKTSVQFHLTWNNLKTVKEKYEYFKLINPQDVPKVFQEALESDVFSSILEVLLKEYVENKQPVYDVLQYLTEVKRFSMLALFMSTEDKNCLQKLMSYAAENEQKSKEEIDNLSKKYEL